MRRKIIGYTLAAVISVPVGLYIKHIIGGELDWHSIVSSVISFIIIIGLIEYNYYKKRKTPEFSMRKIIGYIFAAFISVPVGLCVAGKLDWLSIVCPVILFIMIIGLIEYNDYKKRKKEKN